MKTLSIAGSGIDAPHPTEPGTGPNTPSQVVRPIIVHSDLRWDFAWQRPQHLFSRLSDTRKILFVEQPMFLADVARPELKTTIIGENLIRVVPRLPAILTEAHDSAIETVRELLLELIGDTGRFAGEFRQPVQWFYTPIPAPVMLGAFGESAVVYDCMDSLARFRAMSGELDGEGIAEGAEQCERILLEEADLVFVGGQRLYEEKRHHNDNVHILPGGVDESHFAVARDDSRPAATPVAELPSPVVGYVGVIDERLDYELLRYIARSLPDASIVMVGPVANVRQAELPDEPNIHWVGHREYDELPSLIRGFDVCMIPFVINEITEFRNPTKTLEYMASGKPVVSTPVPEVVWNYSPLVVVVDAPTLFVRAIRKAYEAPSFKARRRALALARRTSWTDIVAEISERTAEAVSSRARRHGSPYAAHDIVQGRNREESHRAT